MRTAGMGPERSLGDAPALKGGDARRREKKFDQPCFEFIHPLASLTPLQPLNLSTRDGHPPHLAAILTGNYAAYPQSWNAPYSFCSAAQARAHSTHNWVANEAIEWFNVALVMMEALGWSGFDTTG